MHPPSDQDSNLLIVLKMAYSGSSSSVPTLKRKHDVFMASGSSSSSAVPTLKRKHDVFMASGSCSSSAVPTLKRKHDVFMASGSCSSSSVPPVSWKYDVFLSFNGDDTRFNFVDHLHTALVQRGICVFKDDEELKRGKAIAQELLKAIEESKFAVVVFSKNYANSSWCLGELAKIMECHNEMGQKVIPVFYHVDPSDIRGQKNKVDVFLQHHEDRFREEMDKVKEWREALKTAANLSGHHISEIIKEGESSFISKIVEEVLADRQFSYMESNLVGIDSHMAALYSLLRIEENDEVRIVGIHGMGGTGKTTIAEALFQRIADKFEGSSFVNDVRENSSKKRDLCTLQEQVIREILMTNQNVNIRDPKDGANMIRARFCRKKVLMVLDDVDNSKQLEFLAATHNWFGPGSRIIITTRNEQLLSDANAKYKPHCLLWHEALELFSRHAFKRDSPPEGYEELSCRAIRCAGYLPLAVKVLGSFFRGREALVWESAFNRLAKAPNVEIFETLKLSFDGLEVSEKQIFLDIACFFKGKCVPDVTKVLESCGLDPLIGINILIEKSLITISCFETICMHDLIQEMGRQIVRESFPNSRLWQLEDIHDSLKNNRKLKKIEAIVVSDEQYDIEEYEKKLGFSANVFENIKNLRLLDIRGRFTSSEPTFFPDNLRWLSWIDYPFSSLSMAFSSLSMTRMSKLVRLEVVGGTIKQFWKGQKIMPNLKIIKLEKLDYLTTFPDVSGAPNIEELFVRNCSKLVECHKSLVSHKRISKLEVSGCKRLKRLPSRFEMESLRFLSLNHCSSLEGFPDVSGAPNIEELVVHDCKNLVEFHKSLVSHKRISKLEVIGCEWLNRLPSRLQMESLEILRVNRCSSLERFPDVSPCMVKLSDIDLDCCSSIEGLLSSLGYLSNLKNLYLGKYSSIRKINIPMCKEYPEKHGFKGLLSSLGYLVLGKYSSIRKIFKGLLSSLGYLVKDDTKALESLPKFIGVNTPIESRSLRRLNLRGRPIESEFFLKNLQSFSFLVILDLTGNNNIIRLPASISHLSFLGFLNLNECHQLQILHGLPSSIKILQANNCYSLEKIDDLLEEYHCCYEISFANCQKLLKDEDSKRCLEKMLQQSFIKRYAVIESKISMLIPGNKIPRWFKEEELKGSKIRVMIPPKCNNQIKGILICAVFPPVDCQGPVYLPRADFYFEKDGVCSPKKEFDCVNASPPAAGDKGNTWICYESCRFIRGFQREESSGGGVLHITVRVFDGPEPVRCASRLIYEEDKEDVKSTQQNDFCGQFGQFYDHYEPNDLWGFDFSNDL